jgi:hypothetical protein
MLIMWRRDTQHNDIQNDDDQHNNKWVSVYAEQAIYNIKPKGYFVKKCNLKLKTEHKQLLVATSSRPPPKETRQCPASQPSYLPVCLPAWLPYFILPTCLFGCPPANLHKLLIKSMNNEMDKKY